MIRTALTLAARGMHVFPCLPRAKLPATAHGCKDATTDFGQIRDWWRREPDYNIAVATGAISKVFAVDIDGDNGEGELRRLEAEYGSLPPTVEAITGRGRHLYFQMPNNEVRNSAGKVAPGIDVRGDGGYTLAPPSIHPTGRAYCWSVDSSNTFAKAPSWLLDKIAEPNGRNAKPAPSSRWLELVRDGISEGRRNDSLARLAGFLLRRHVDALVATEIVLAVNDARCRPPLEHDEVIAIIDSIAAREMKRRGI